MDYDFTTPNARTLAQIDSWMQASEWAVQWEYAGVPDHYVNDGGIGWEGVEKNEPASFKTAWFTALAFMASKGIENDQIKI